MKLSKQISSQKGQSNVLIVVVILAIAVLAGWYFLRNKTNTAYQTNQPTQQTSATSIQNDNDLMSASSELDQEDIYGTVDPQLNQNDIDAQTF